MTYKDHKDHRDHKDDEATAAALEQPTEADIDSDTDSDNTLILIKVRLLPLSVLLRLKSTALDWQMDTLTQFLAISSPSEASDTVPD